MGCWSPDGMRDICSWPLIKHWRSPRHMRDPKSQNLRPIDAQCSKTFDRVRRETESFIGRICDVDRLRLIHLPADRSSNTDWSGRNGRRRRRRPSLTQQQIPRFQAERLPAAQNRLIARQAGKVHDAARDSQEIGDRVYWPNPRLFKQKADRRECSWSASIDDAKTRKRDPVPAEDGSTSSSPRRTDR
jgi:hypothetical protein